MDSKWVLGMTITDHSFPGHQCEPTMAVTSGVRSTSASAPPITPLPKSLRAMRHNGQSEPGRAYVTPRKNASQPPEDYVAIAAAIATQQKVGCYP